MLNKIKHLALVLLLCVCTVSMALPVDVSKATKVANNFWKSNSETSKFSGDLVFTNLASTEGYSGFYIFKNAIGEGFVVVSADDCVIPVLAYSATGNLDESFLPENMKTMLSWYEKQIRYCASHNLSATEDIALQWERYSAETIAIDKSSTSFVRPMVTTKWNQSPIYNDLCPYDGRERKHTYAGCVAVAMAQTLKYWNHPITGIGSNSYNHETYGTISVHFDNTTYDWANMPQTLSNLSTHEQTLAVSTLMFHCGAAVNMYYGMEGSSAGVNGDYYGTSEWAFKHFFGYKPTLWSADRLNYSDSAWTELIRQELDNHRPVLYTGYDTTDTNDVVGHAFVCDGYDTNDYFHFNWGWGGQCDGYYAMTNLTPSHVFNAAQRAIIGMEPDTNQLRVTPTSLSLPGNGGNSTVTVLSATYPSNWTARPNSPWVSVSTASGPGMGATSQLTITAQPNTTGQSRSATVSILQDSLVATVYISQPDFNNSNGGWYGNNLIDAEEAVMATTQNMILIRPESYGDYAVGDKITHIKFKTRIRTPGYNNKNFIIKIFRNPDFNSHLANGECDSNTALGRMVYNESFLIQNADIEQIIPLSTPYTITSAPFWIGLYSSGGTLYKSHKHCINNIPSSNVPLLDSLNFHYLKVMTDGHVCPALEITDNSGTSTQCEIEYYFQYMVELAETSIEDASRQIDVTIYPNPTSGIVNFSDHVQHVDVYNNMGHNVLSADNATSIDMSNLRKGLYIIRLTTDQGSAMRKVIRK